MSNTLKMAVALLLSFFIFLIAWSIFCALVDTYIKGYDVAWIMFSGVVSLYVSHSQDFKESF